MPGKSTSKIRLFVAIDLPKAFKQKIIGMCDGIPGARWTTSDNLHLTLKFIGHVDQYTYERIKNVLKQVKGQPFSLHCHSLGNFNRHGASSTLWLGIDEAPQLTTLVADVVDCLTNIIKLDEDFPFTPHVTLARCRHIDNEDYQRYIDRFKDFDAGVFPVEAFHLYSSRSDNEGPHYQIEASYPLSE